jgi:hypothetical protein
LPNRLTPSVLRCVIRTRTGWTIGRRTGKRGRLRGGSWSPSSSLGPPDGQKSGPTTSRVEVRQPGPQPDGALDSIRVGAAEQHLALQQGVIESSSSEDLSRHARVRACEDTLSPTAPRAGRRAEPTVARAEPAKITWGNQAG